MSVKRISVKDAQFPTGKEIDHYVILERIDICAHYVDYMAVDKRNNKHVALKVLIGELSDSQQNWKNYYQQTKMLSALEHPGFAAVLYFSQYEGLDYVVTVYFSGYNFQSFLNEGHLFTPDKALWFMKGSIDILEYASRFNILHLNIRPAGMGSDWLGQIKTINLGFIQCYNRLADKVKYDCMRNPEYISPDHIQGDPNDVRADIYSLGATVFHLMTGYPPFEASMAQEICQMHLEAPFPKERAYAAKLPVEWINLISRMMEKKAEDRFQNYIELAEAVFKLEAGMAKK